jgi:predicted Zn-dependent peptidase
VKGRLALSLESTLTRMNRLGGSVLMGIPLLSLDEMVDRIDAVDADSVAALADELFAPERMSAAGVGGDEATFMRALEPVNPELAAAA